MRNLLIIFLAVFSVVSYASEINGVKVKQLSINENYGDFIFIKLSQSPERIACSKNGYWDYTLKLSTDADKALYSMLLMAASSGKSINVSGLDQPACNEFNTIESASRIDLNVE
ncbi:hypothetical protein [Gallaecimonas pentaromativorans]|uniref:Uncharacterized protein n=1 Tax=Gallaecimonas pentaromativorans TaxID=584787 RepID=A0A3N1P4J1_9GAMM|nr:hypothetical protein [Gallaecimonas pentaromativorans]ROQ23373.1 hypothetical protein EDC28_108111 [Gallaecimonas pentaromativorans]